MTAIAFLYCPPMLSKQICLSETMGASSWKACTSRLLGLSSSISMDGDVEDHGSPLPQVLGFAHSSISVDFRSRKHALKHPWLRFGSFLDVLIQFRSPWKAQARSRVLIVLNQPSPLEEGWRQQVEVRQAEPIAVTSPSQTTLTKPLGYLE